MYETLHDVIDAIETEYSVIFPAVYGGIGYTESRRFCITPNYEKSKLSPRSKKMLQVTIWRLDSGRYEVVAYTL